ncbi:MAG: DUF429 domain-containing protein [Anaerolineae bacterium]
MTIYGLDFTSAPRKRKPITCAVCTLEGTTLHYERIEHLTSFTQFEAFLQRPGPWVAGFDFPFGQPRDLIERLGWPQTWAGYVGWLGGMRMKQFEHILRMFRDSRPRGQKHLYRQVDAPTGAISPMLLYRIPIGRMFFRGAPRLLASGVSVIPCHPTESDRVALEAYPALVARRWLGSESYKNDVKDKQTAAQKDARRRLVQALRSAELHRHYGLRLTLGDANAAHLIEDPGGDDLDALLCAIQAAWAALRRESGWGIPAGVDRLEGWIVDPISLSVPTPEPRRTADRTT